MRDRKLTGPWAGFSFRRGKLVSPEGHEFGPDDLRWLALTVQIKHEWQAMMRDAQAGLPYSRPGTVVYFRDAVRARHAARQSGHRRSGGRIAERQPQP